MKIQYSCNVSEENKAIIEPLITVWSENNPTIKGGEWVLEVRKILSRSFTRAITFLARFVRPGKEGISRVFKIDLYDNAQIEARGAFHLDSTITAKFFCRVKNNPANDFWYEPDGDLFGIIEYEYAGDMGTSDSVETLQNFVNENLEILDNKKEIKQFDQKFLALLDDVIQGLKAKLYKRSTVHNVTVKDVFSSKIKHFNSDFVHRTFQDLPPYLEKIYDISPSVMYNDISNTLNLQLENHYSSPYIHGDLNPTNILVYSGFDRDYAAMIDFLEIEKKKEEGFTPYFWDFARLEAELTLSFFNHGYISKSDIANALDAVTDTQFNIDIKSNSKLEIYFLSNLIYQLRKSFFRTKGLNLDISFDSPDVLKSFYVNLFVFYLFITKFDNSQLEKYIALIFAHKLALNIKKIDSKWVEEKIKKLDKEDKTRQQTKPLSYIIASSILIMAVVLFFIFKDSRPDFPISQLETAEKLLFDKLYKDAGVQFDKLKLSTKKEDYPYYYSRIKLGEAKVYFYQAEIKDREVNLKNAKASLKDSLEYCEPKKYKKLATDIYYYLSRTYVQLSQIRNAEETINTAIEYSEKALSLISKNRRPFEYANIQLSLAEAYKNFSDIKDRKVNIEKARNHIEESLNYFTMAKHPFEFAYANHLFGTIYYYSSKVDNDLANKVEYINRAIDYFKIALVVRKLEKYPLEYAKTQNNLALALIELADHIDKEKNLENAIDAFRSALSVYSNNKKNVDVAKIKINIIGTYLKLASIRNREKNLTKAIEEGKEALNLLPIVKFPRYHAKAQINLGVAYYYLFQLTPEREYIKSSIYSFKQANRIYSKNELSYADTERKLGLAFLAGAIGAEDSESYYKKSIESFKEALKYYIEKQSKLMIMKLSINIAENYIELANMKESLDHLKEAKKYYQKALENINEKETDEIDRIKQIIQQIEKSELK